MREAVLLVNLGTPDSPSPLHVARYLAEFLNDKRVIDIHPVARFFLVNFIIIPFRSFKSSRLYKAIWTKEGSPLLLNSISLRDKFQRSLGEKYIVELAMRYRSPAIREAVHSIMRQHVSKIHIIPLYPQYSGSSTGSCVERVLHELRRYEVIPSLNIIGKFYDHPAYYKAMMEAASGYDITAYDHVLFSYHGLPERQIRKASAQYVANYCRLGDCCGKINNNNRYCYRANCMETTRRLVSMLQIPEGRYNSAFQSRLDDKWLKPYSDKTIAELAGSGVKRLLVFSPSFVSDCLETLYEIEIEYREIFIRHGGMELTMVKSLNDNETWVEALKQITGLDDTTE